MAEERHGEKRSNEGLTRLDTTHCCHLLRADMYYKTPPKTFIDNENLQARVQGRSAAAPPPGADETVRLGRVYFEL